MKCPSCLKKIDDNAEFCPLCGKKIVRDLACPKCGTKNSLTSIFCKKCGASLKKKVAKEEPQIVEEPIKDNKSNNRYWLLSIMAMSSMILAMVLMLGLIFAPFLHDDFFGGNLFSITGWVEDSLINIKPIKETRNFATVANCVILPLVLLSFFGIAFAMLVIHISKMIKAIKAKKYEDLSKGALVCFIFYLAIYVYFARFVLSPTYSYLDYLGFAPIFIFILIPVLLIFNIFVKTLLEKKENLKEIIIRSLFAFTLFILLFVTAINLGGTKFHINATLKQQNNAAAVSQFDAGIIQIGDFLGTLSKSINRNALSRLIPAILLITASAIFEVVILLFNSMSIYDIFKNTPNKKLNSIRGVVFSIISVTLSMANIICIFYSNVLFNTFTMFDFNKSGVYFQNKVVMSSAITVFVLSSVVLIIYLVYHSLNKTSGKKKEIVHE